MLHVILMNNLTPIQTMAQQGGLFVKLISAKLPKTGCLRNMLGHHYSKANFKGGRLSQMSTSANQPKMGQFCIFW
jgi:hypothetical protein